MKLKINCGSKSFEVEILDRSDARDSRSPLMTFSDLKTAIADEANLDSAQMKIIHRGKTLAGPDDTPLIDFKFKEGDRCMVMGKTRAALKDDAGFTLLVNYEKQKLMEWQSSFEGLGVDLGELEKNFLDIPKTREMIKRMDKRLKTFREYGERHLEALDSLQINSESTAAEQAQRNREKRKALVNGINHLLNLNDKHLARLDEFSSAIADKEAAAAQ